MSDVTGGSGVVQGQLDPQEMLATITRTMRALDEKRDREQRDLQIVCHDDDVDRLRAALVALDRRHLLGNVLPSPYAPRGTAYVIDRSQLVVNLDPAGSMSRTPAAWTTW